MLGGFIFLLGVHEFPSTMQPAELGNQKVITLFLRSYS